MDTLFQRIIAGELPAQIVYRDERVTAFRDIRPRAPMHILIVPNKLIATANDIADTDEALDRPPLYRGARSCEAGRHCRGWLSPHHQLQRPRRTGGVSTCICICWAASRSGRWCRPDRGEKSARQEEGGANPSCASCIRRSRPSRPASCASAPCMKSITRKSGNPKGKPAVFLHGGPGGGTDPKMRRFFDPKRYRIVLFDQRGWARAGRTPRWWKTPPGIWSPISNGCARISAIERWLVFGGSWGSTLGLAYAQTHPERVTHLVLRGIFLLGAGSLNGSIRTRAAPQRSILICGSTTSRPYPKPNAAT